MRMRPMLLIAALLAGCASVWPSDAEVAAFNLRGRIEGAWREENGSLSPGRPPKLALVFRADGTVFVRRMEREGAGTRTLEGAKSCTYRIRADGLIELQTGDLAPLVLAYVLKPEYLLEQTPESCARVRRFSRPERLAGEGGR